MYIYSLAGIIGGIEYWRIWKFDKIKVKAILILSTCSMTFRQFCQSVKNCNHYTCVEWYTVKYYKINVQAKLMRSEHLCSNYMYSVHCINFLLKLNC